MPGRNNIAQLIDEMYLFKLQKEKADAEYQKRRSILLKEFDATAARKLSSDTHVAICKKTLAIEYDVEKLEGNQRLSKAIKKQIVQRVVRVIDYEGLVELLKSAGVTPAQFKQHISVSKYADQEAIKSLFDHELLSLDDLDGCYVAQLKKSIEIR